MGQLYCSKTPNSPVYRSQTEFLVTDISSLFARRWADNPGLRSYLIPNSADSDPQLPEGSDRYIRNLYKSVIRYCRYKRPCEIEEVGPLASKIIRTVWRNLD